MTGKDLFYTSERSEWRAYLAAHFETSQEIWFVFPTKSSGEKALSYNDAVEEALCFGWIDGRAGTLDETHHIRRFTPRRKGSAYSQPNIERLIWLDAHGLIHPKVRESVKDVIEKPFVYPEDILDALRKDATVWANYQSFSEPYRRIRIAYIDAARKRPEELQKRLINFIEKTRRNQLIMGYGGIDRYYRQTPAESEAKKNCRDNRIVAVNSTNLSDAGWVHAASWRESHRSVCTPAFLESHTAERQATYLESKMQAGSRIFLLIEDGPIGVVSVTGNLIEDLYVLPEKQGQGFGTALLRFAVDQCKGAPSLWILENNTRAKRLYERLGFSETGRRKTDPGKLDEIELSKKEERRMETERLIIDCVKETDKEDYFYNISHDRKVLETFVCRYAETLEDFDFSTYPGRDDLFAIRLKETGRLIGIILYFDEQDGACEIGYGIGSAHWGKGYVTEATKRFLTYLFSEKGMHKIYASYFTGNDASRRVMEKCGMTFSRFSAQEMEYLGEMRDLTYYAIENTDV